MSIGPALSALRRSTGDVHQALEDEAAIEPRLRSLSTRAAAVAGFHAFHLDVEEALAPWREPLTGVAWRPMSRARRIARDLGLLNGDPAPRRMVPAPASLGEALGWAYVAEGSMLGGRVILRGLAEDRVNLRGLDFLDPHGPATGERWRGFIATLEAAVAEGRARLEDVLAGAHAAFAHARGRLAPAAAPEPVHG